MPALKWNLCTSFAAIGVGIAFPILFAIFGLYWQLLPGAVAGLVAAYVVSTALGTLALRLQFGRYPIGGIFASVGVAWATLIAGAVAITSANFLTAIIGALLHAPSGQPASNVLAEIAADYSADFIGDPLVIGIVFGILPAAVLGVIYGGMLRARFDGALAETPVARKWVRIAATFTMLFVLLLALAFVAFPRRAAESTALMHQTPIAIRECGEAAAADGILAYCRGSPCENGECNWEIDQDAFKLHVRPPVGSDWRWAGGGIGTGRRPDVVKHNIYWVQYEPDGSLNEGSPRHYASYELIFKGKFVDIGTQRFIFEPGMQLKIQFLDDWSVTASAGLGSE